MLNDLDNFYLKYAEPQKSCLLALREIVMMYDKGISQEWKYKLPFFYYKGKPLCYLWIHKINKQPYIGFVDGNKMDHPQLLFENRSRIKILLFDPNVDIDIKIINQILKKAIAIKSKIIN